MDEWYGRFEIKPKVKQRPRLGKGGRVFTPKATQEYEALIAEMYNGPLFTGPLEMNLTFGRDWIEVDIFEFGGFANDSKLRGDLDNYIKSITDGLNEVAYGDDRQIKRIHAEIL